MELDILFDEIFYWFNEYLFMHDWIWTAVFGFLAVFTFISYFLPTKSTFIDPPEYDN